MLKDMENNAQNINAVKENIDYFGLVKESIKIVRHNKYLWFLGILAGSGSVGFRGTGINYSFGGVTNTGRNTPNLDNIINWVHSNLLLIITIASIIFLFLIILSVLSNMARSGLIDSIEKITKNEESSFLAAMKFGWRKFWKVFAAGLIVGLVNLAAFLFFAVIGLGLFFLNPFLILLPIIFGLIVIFPLAVVSGIIYEYALRYISIKEEGAVQSLKSSIQLIKQRKMETLYFWLVSLLLGFLAGIVIIVAVIFILIVLALLGVLFYLINHIAGFVYIGLAVTAFIILASLAGGFLSAVMSSFWTLAFKKITD